MFGRVGREMKRASLVRRTPIHTFGSSHRMKLWALVNRQRREGANHQY
jgi:hypothetical protein